MLPALKYFILQTENAYEINLLEKMKKKKILEALRNLVTYRLKNRPGEENGKWFK